jgi:prepilin-type N-terminal cleavage/methylation domain-containing protein
MGGEKGSSRKLYRDPLAGALKGDQGFTLLELVAVLIILSLLAGIAISKYIQVMHEAEIASEDSTISNLQASIDTHWAQMIIKGDMPSYPHNPFATVKKLPANYSLAQRIPSRTKKDRRIWLFLHYSPETIKKLGITFLESKNAPSLLKNAKGQYKPESVTQIDGLVLHQRRDDNIYYWIYDRKRGVISDRYQFPTI